MRKVVLTFIFSLFLVISLAVSAQAGDFVISLDCQDLGSNVNIEDIVDIDGSGSAWTLDAQYFFTDRFSLELAYSRGSFESDLLGLIGIDYTSDTYNLQANYLFPIGNKFALGGFAGYKSYKLSGDGWIDIPTIIHGSLNNLYELKMSGILLGIKAVYKPTEQFTLESSLGEIINPSLDAELLNQINVPDQYIDDEYYYQFDITSSYWFTPNFALRAGYSYVKTGFTVPIGSTDIDFDRKYDGLHVGMAWKF